MTRGGKRQGAGRPPVDTVAVQIRMTPEAAEELRFSAKLKQMTLGNYVAWLVKLDDERKALGSYKAQDT